MMKNMSFILGAVLVLAMAGTVCASELSDTFASAPAEYSPVPIWWWSGDPIERELIKDQLTKMAAGGIHNAIILNLAPSGPLYGSAPDEPPFLSDEWWNLFAYTLDVGKEVGVRIWFYDQLGFSGAGLQARVVRDNPEFRGVNLNRVVRDIDGPAEVELQTPAGADALAAFVAERVVDENVETIQQAKWIWDADRKNEEVKLYFRRTIDLESLPQQAKLSITCDNGYVLYVNGKKIGEESSFAESGWKNAESFDVLSSLSVGKNVLAVVGENLGGEAGLLLNLKFTTNSEERTVVSDATFRVSEKILDGWTASDFDDSAWKKASVLGAPPMNPWGQINGIDGEADVNDLGVKVKDVQNVTDRIAENRIKIDVPAGPHRVSLFYTAPGGFDYQNPDAGKALLQLVHGEMERRFGDELGKAIAGSFQDEFPALPRYSKRLADEFRKRKGYDLLERLPALYDDVIAGADEPATVRIRCDANDVAAILCEEAFFIPLHEWHEKYGMLCGYDQTVRNADPNRGERYYIDYFKTMRHYSVPGNDMDGDCKPHQSIADLYNRPRVWIEAFHSSGWGQTIEEINTLLNPWLVNGGTLYNPHAIYYSIHGSYWEWAPPDTGWRQPYFKHFDRFSDYVARLTYVLSQGKHDVKTGVLHPANTIHGYTGFGSGAPAAQRSASQYWAVQNALRSVRADYIILDEDSIQRAAITEGKLSVSGIDLRVVVLPDSLVLSGKTLQKLTRFVELGGTFILVGEPPLHAADDVLIPERFHEGVDYLKTNSIRLDSPSEVAAEVLKAVPRETNETVPVLRRKTGDRDFFFILSDDGTAQNSAARFDINKRKLWETAAGRGKRMAYTLSGDGIPERWDPLTGETVPIYNYKRNNGKIRVDVELADSPAPLISLRPPAFGDPVSIESDLNIIDWKRAGIDSVTIRGIQRISSPETDSESHFGRVQFSNDAFEGSTSVKKSLKIDVPGPLHCRLEPTCYNQYGDFAWPPSDDPIPIEIRAARYHSEANAGKSEIEAWKTSTFNDSEWKTAIASFGPRAEWAGPLPLKSGQTFETLKEPPDDVGPTQQAIYSLRLGIDEDPVFRSALGGKGRIPEDFIDLGHVQSGAVYIVSAMVTSPANDQIDALLRVGGSSKRRVFLNGTEVRFPGAAAARKARMPVRLNKGANRLEILVSRDTDGPIRLFYHFLPPTGIPDDPEWIWSHQPGANGKSLFVKQVNIPGEIESANMTVALGDMHQIRINGKLVADQGNFDPYFTSRAERYSIQKFLQTGENRIEIEARDTGSPTGLLIDGLVILKDKRHITFVSDHSFSVQSRDGSNSKPARILNGPAHSYMGDPALMLLQARPHPLPSAGWLNGQEPPDDPYGQLVYGIDAETPAAGWYRFRIPPGAIVMAFKAAGPSQFYLNGDGLELDESNGYHFAKLPNPDSPKRIAALRIESIPGFTGGAALLEPILFVMGDGKIPYGSWDRLGLPHYSGGMVYDTNVEIPFSSTMRYTLDLGRVRGTVETFVNGKSCGVRLWHPYRFDMTDAVKDGSNQIEFHVYNTLGPHFATGHPSGHVFENQTLSGIFGPVTVHGLNEVEIQLKKQ